MPHRITRDEAMRDEMIASVLGASAKVAPPVTVVGAIAAGITIDAVVLLLTIVYLLVQIGYLGWRWHGEWRKRKSIQARRRR